MAITVKEKELVAVGISVASGCKPCTNFHVGKARGAGAPDREIEQAVVDALSVRECATEFIKSHALARLDHDRSPRLVDSPSTTNHVRQMIFVGAAIGVNCTSNLETHLVAARATGISIQEIAEIAELAASIKQQAATHVARLAGMSETEAGGTAA